MSVPKQRHTKERRDRKRKRFKIAVKSLVECNKCRAMILPHTVCPKCGYYKDREVINVLKKSAKKKRKK